METYTFSGILHDEMMGVEVEIPLEFSIILAPDADQSLLDQAAKVVVYALVDSMKEDPEIGRDNGYPGDDGE
jgi:hypothetical protein